MSTGGCRFSSNRLWCGRSCGWSVHTDRPVHPPRDWWTQGHGERYGKARDTAQALRLCRGKPPVGSPYICVLAHGTWTQNSSLCFTSGTRRETANELVQSRQWHSDVQSCCLLAVVHRVNKNRMMALARRHSSACAAENRAAWQGRVVKLLSVNRDMAEPARVQRLLSPLPKATLVPEELLWK